MNSAEVIGFVNHFCAGHPQEVEKVAESLVAECRSRWDEMNKSKKNSSKIGDLPYLKFGCDDITAVVSFFTYNDDD
jgi:integrin-linked kinase-associated serine/threonine phosphatase 2C